VHAQAVASIGNMALRYAPYKAFEHDTARSHRDPARQSSFTGACQDMKAINAVGNFNNAA
jgi:hypothetical protein